MPWRHRACSFVFQSATWVSAEMVSICRDTINNAALWKQSCICFFFTSSQVLTTFFYFVPLYWTLLVIILWYAALPLSSGLPTKKEVSACVCYVPQGKKHICSQLLLILEEERRHGCSVVGQSLAADVGREYCCHAALLDDLRFCAY